MTPESWTRVKELVADALERPPSERDSFLDTACDDPAVRSRVLELLAAEQDSSAFLEDPPPIPVSRIAVPTRFASDDRIGGASSGAEQGVGGFVVTRRRLASGASGDVYEAVQDHPSRRVALKVLRHALLSPTAAARFEREAELLAQLHHPGIAQVFAAGVDEPTEIAFIAMELVDQARTLTAFAEEHKLSSEQRVELLIRVCEAAQHAHERSIVHRDLKPANILVDEAGNPRIVDFGVARIIKPEGATQTIQTRRGDVVGTLAYMSPEQCDTSPDADIDARADVYALGVLLFELLTSRRPIDVDALPIDEALRAIRLEPPPTAHSINPAVPAPVAAIAAKALRKNPADRYPSAAALASDLRRALDDKPVTARSPSILYSASLFVKRNTAAVVAASLVFVALLAAAITSSLALTDARRATTAAEQAAAAETEQRTIAENALLEEARQRRAAESTTEYLKIILEPPRPFRLNADVTLKSQLDRLADRFDKAKDLDPIVGAVVAHQIAHTYMEMLEFDRATPYFERSIELYEQAAPVSLGHALSIVHYAAMLQNQKDHERSELLYRKALEIREQISEDGKPHRTAILHNLAGNMWLRGDHAAAEGFHRVILQLRIQEYGEAHLMIAASHHEIARCQLEQEHYDAAIASLQTGLEVLDHLDTALSHPMLAALISKQGIAAREKGDHDAALAYFTRSWTLARDHRSPGSPDWMFLLENYLDALLAAGQADTEAAQLGAAIDSLSQHAQPSDPRLVKLKARAED